MRPHNGFVNYSTWLIALSIDNDRDLYDKWYKKASQRSVEWLANDLLQGVTDTMTFTAMRLPYFLMRLMHFSIMAIDFREVAAHIKDMDHNAPFDCNAIVALANAEMLATIDTWPTTMDRQAFNRCIDWMELEDTLTAQIENVIEEKLPQDKWQLAYILTDFVQNLDWRAIAKKYRGEVEEVQ